MPPGEGLGGLKMPGEEEELAWAEATGEAAPRGLLSAGLSFTVLKIAFCVFSPPIKGADGIRGLKGTKGEKVSQL